MFLIAYWYDAGWREAAGLFVLTMVAGFLTSLIIGMIGRGDNLLIWLAATIAIWPVALILGSFLTWFGLVGL